MVTGKLCETCACVCLCVTITYAVADDIVVLFEDK
jgi:hypothetical protein